MYLYENERFKIGFFLFQDLWVQLGDVVTKPQWEQTDVTSCVVGGATIQKL